MKLIISRKGFDSSFGGCASPILPDGQIVSLPIPEPGSGVRYSELQTRGLDIGKLVCDLSRNPNAGDTAVHLDPDLESSAQSRQAGWLAAFGQDGSAQSHLQNEGVGPEDLFLFFGWFRKVELVEGKYRYVARAPDLHIVFGWLRVGRVLRIGRDPVPEWLQDHPHAMRNDWPSNAIYVSNGSNGGGVFPAFDSRLVLTEQGKSRSVWRLPSDFLPRGRPALTFHRSAERWKKIKDGCRLKSVAKGQEFVLDLDQYPAVHRWAEELVMTSMREMR